MTKATQRSSEDSGFTLIELIVSMTIGIVVLLAVLQTFDVFTASAGEQQRSTDADAQARRAMALTVTDLRGAATLKVADPNNVTYTVSEANSVTRLIRLCLAPDGFVYRYASTTTLTVPTACASGTRMTSLKALNDAASPLFRYDGASSSGTPERVRNVAINIRLDASTTQRKRRSSLQSSVVLRKAVGSLPVAPEDILIDCTASGNASQPTTSLVQLAAGVSQDLGPVTVTYATTTGVTLGGGLSAITLPPGVTQVVARITDAAGITTSITKTVGCQ